MKRKIHGLFVILACLTSLPACASMMYSAEPMEAKVVDAETKQPLEGVIVTANWELRGPATAGGSAPIGQLMVLETVTGKDGKFYFPAWGPKSAHGALLNRDPQLLLFKPGYRYRGLENEFRDGMELEPMRRSIWNGKTIELKAFKGTMEEYEELFEDFNHMLERIATDQPTECHWKNLQKTIRAMNQERSRLVTLGVNPDTLSSIDNELLMNDQFYTKKGGCGSPKEFFGGFKQ